MMHSHMTTIGDIAQVFDGPHATPKKISSGPYFLSISSLEKGRLDLTKSAFLSEEDFKKWTKRITPEEGDLLFSYETRLGEAALMPAGVKACLGRRMGLLRFNKDKVIPEYVLYAYLSPAFQQTIKANTLTGATVDRLSISEFPDFPIRIPPLEEQEKVANLLGCIDKKIDLNNRINAELEAMAKTLYDYWFVQFDFPDTNGKPYKSSGGKMASNGSSTPAIPQEWRVGNASELFDFNPVTPLKKGCIASYIDMNSLPVKGFMTKKSIRKEFAGGSKFIKNDIAVARITPCLENGKTGVLSKLEEGEVGFGSTEFIILRGKNFPLSSFGACLARSDSFRQFAISNMTGTSGRKRIESKILETYTLPIPSKNLLMKFEEIVHPFFDIMTFKSIENDELAALRDWLLPLLMNGQVTVR
ncbi:MULTISPECIES: restriction endonuclease subunit S [Serratia]|uniref:restriction endonuclease subunit S n=1 Tax=Serratia TaxID=613 RepID=UPI0021B7866E|nr:restriction endonuclease subunit S [Serratia liquefaciens]